MKNILSNYMILLIPIILIIVSGFIYLFYTGNAQRINSNHTLADESQISAPSGTVLRLISKGPDTENVNQTIVNEYTSRVGGVISKASFNTVTNELKIKTAEEEQTIPTNGTVIIDEENSNILYYTPQNEQEEIQFTEQLIIVPDIDDYTEQTASFDEMLEDAQLVAGSFGITEEPTQYVTNPDFGIMYDTEGFNVTIYYENYEPSGYSVVFDNIDIQEEMTFFAQNFVMLGFADMILKDINCFSDFCEIVEDAGYTYEKVTRIEFDEGVVTSIGSIGLLRTLNEENLRETAKKIVDFTLEIQGIQTSETTIICTPAGTKIQGPECTYKTMTCGQSTEYGVICWHA